MLLKNYTNLSLENVLYPDDHQRFNWSLVIFPLLSILYFYVLWKLLSKENREPTHIFDLANFIVTIVWGCCNGFGLGMFQKLLSPWSPVCVVMNFIGLVSRQD